MVTLRASNAQALFASGMGAARIESITLATRTSGDGRPEGICFVVVTNIGTDDDDFTVRFYDYSAGAPGVLLEETLVQTIPWNGSATFQTSQYRLLDLTPVYGAWALPSGRQPGDTGTAFAQTSQATTTITIAVTPPRANPGASIITAGRLTRNDTQAGVAGQTIYVSHAPQGVTPPPWVSDGSATTDAGGNYSRALIAPARGKYVYDATFLGNTVAGLEASQGQTEVLVEAFAAPAVAGILIPLALGAGLIFASVKSR